MVSRWVVEFVVDVPMAEVIAALMLADHLLRNRAARV